MRDADAIYADLETHDLTSELLAVMSKYDLLAVDILTAGKRADIVAARYEFWRRVHALGYSAYRIAQIHHVDNSTVLHALRAI